jgi:hypothetical protein
MASRESNLSTLYAELHKLGQNGEYERALKTANRSKLKIKLFITIVKAKFISTTKVIGVIITKVSVLSN